MRWWAIVGLVSIVGCGDSLKHFPTAKVEGRVLCDGKPVANVLIRPLESILKTVASIKGFSAPTSVALLFVTNKLPLRSKTNPRGVSSADAKMFGVPFGGTYDESYW